MSDFSSSIVVSILGLAVIFVALSSLILLIKVMVFLAPAPQKPHKKGPSAKSAPAAPASAGAGPASPEHSAVIQSVLAHHLGRPPAEIHITSVKPL